MSSVQIDRAHLQATLEDLIEALRLLVIQPDLRVLAAGREDRSVVRELERVDLVHTVTATAGSTSLVAFRRRAGGLLHCVKDLSGSDIPLQ